MVPPAEECRLVTTVLHSVRASLRSKTIKGGGITGLDYILCRRNGKVEHFFNLLGAGLGGRVEEARHKKSSA